MVIHHHLTGDACFPCPVNKLCGKMRDDTWEREAREMRRQEERHLQYAKTKMSVNNRKSEGLVEQIWALWDGGGTARGEEVGKVAG